MSVLFIKPLLVLLILAVFIAKLLLVAFYQQRTGDYFYNKMFYRYNKIEIGISAFSGRKKVMVMANWLNAILWGLAILLAVINIR